MTHTHANLATPSELLREQYLTLHSESLGVISQGQPPLFLGFGNIPLAHHLVAFTLGMPEELVKLLQPLLQMEQKEIVSVSLASRNYPLHYTMVALEREPSASESEHLLSFMDEVMSQPQSERVLIADHAFLWHEHSLCLGSAQPSAKLQSVRPRLSAYVRNVFGIEVGGWDIHHTVLARLKRVNDQYSLKEWGKFTTSLHHLVNSHPMRIPITGMYVGPLRSFLNKRYPPIVEGP